MALNFGPFVFGGNVFGWTVQREEAFALLDAFVERGGVAIDTADVYPAWAAGGGVSESILGEWMAARKNRSKLLIATKVGMWSERPGLSAANINAAIDASLQRLKTDHVDVYYAHKDDTAVEQSEYVRAFDALVKAGKVRTLGASNFTPARLASALSFSRQHQLRGFEVSQDHWNLVERGVEQALVPLLAREGLRELPYFSLASGFLTGKYRPGQPVDSSRAEAAGKYLAQPQNLALLRELDALAAKRGVSVAAIALAWLRAQPVVGAPIASARTASQLAPLFEAATVQLSAQELAALSAITAASAATGH